MALAANGQSRALIGDTIVQTRRLQEGIEQFFPVGQNSGMPARGLPAGEDRLEELAKIGVGIKHGQNRQRGDGEEGKGVAGLGLHGFYIELSGRGWLFPNPEAAGQL
jgi:hypothetical protein